MILEGGVRCSRHKDQMSLLEILTFVFFQSSPSAFQLI